VHIGLPDLPKHLSTLERGIDTAIRFVASTRYCPHSWRAWPGDLSVAGDGHAAPSCGERVEEHRDYFHLDSEDRGVCASS